MMSDKVTEADASPTEHVLDERQAQAIGQGKDASTDTASNGEGKKFADLRNNASAKSIWRFITWTPKRCRWDPESPPKFSMGLNILFAFVSVTIIVSTATESSPALSFHHMKDNLDLAKEANLHSSWSSSTNVFLIGRNIHSRKSLRMLKSLLPFLSSRTEAHQRLKDTGKSSRNRRPERK